MNQIVQFMENTKVSTMCFGAVASIGALYLARKTLNGVSEKKLASERKKKLVVISGCDSGLGLTMAAWAAKAGYQVLAGCLDDNGKGAQYLRDQFKGHGNMHTFSLDVTSSDGINKFRDECQTILKNKTTVAGEPLQLWAVINNAAVAVIGEHLWLTQEQSERQMNVNFWGTVNFTSSFKSMLLQHKCRLIAITSDCSEYPLPMLALYCASKAAQESWVRSFRLEVAKYGVSVVAYQPGAFQNESKLMAAQYKNYQEMKERMDEQDKIFYGEYFDEFYESKNFFFKALDNSDIKPIENYGGRKHFFNILEGNISSTPVYIYEDFGGKIFHSMLKYLPQKKSDNLVNHVMVRDCKKLWQPIDYK